MDTDDRRALMQISEASIDTVARALLDGDFEFFMDHLPTNPVSNNLTMDMVEDYKAALLRLIARTEPNGKCNISRDELRVIFEWCVGDMPKSPNKFTSRMKHHRIITQRLRVRWCRVPCHHHQLERDSRPMPKPVLPESLKLWPARTKTA
jgi:hypothetical protein